jgi:hypothetical protein
LIDRCSATKSCRESLMVTVIPITDGVATAVIQR